MRFRILVLAGALCVPGVGKAATGAQPAPAQVIEATGAIWGVVRDGGTGAFLAGVQMVLTGATGTQQTSTSLTGDYRFSNVKPGEYNLEAHNRGEVIRKLPFSVAAGQLLQFDFETPPRTLLSGRVLDENGEPLQGFRVYLMHETYSFGRLSYSIAESKATNARGEYALTRALPGSSYLLVARRAEAKVDPNSKQPAEPEAREPALAETWYPDSLSAETALPVFLTRSERREGLNIRVRRLRPRCIEGVVEDANGPAPLDISVKANALGGSVWPDSKASPDGRFRICGVPHVEFGIYAYRKSPGAAQLGSAVVPAGDMDLTGLRILTTAGSTLHGEVTLDGQSSPEPNSQKPLLELVLFSMDGIGAPVTSVAIPGTFAFPNVAPGDRVLAPWSLPKDLYVKDIVASGVSVLHKPFRPSGDVRIELGRGGGSIAVQVRDAEGKPVPGAWVVIARPGADSEASFAAAMGVSKTDPIGNCRFTAVAPGKYLVLATQFPVDLSRDRVARAFRALAKAKQVEVGSGVSVVLNVTPVAADQ
jgi:protocatechuate 3,4-dioxygenase beta subunit